MAETKRQRSTETTPLSQGEGEVRLRPLGRRVQVPQLVVALLLVGVGALASVVLYTQASAREPVLAVAEPVQRGQVVAAEDLRVVYLASDDPVLSLAPDQLPSLVGQVAVAGLEVGTIVTDGQFAERTSVGDGQAMVGLSLSPGEYPTVQLAPGDVVDVVDTESSDVVVARRAVVFDVVELGAQGQRLVSLLLDVDTAAAVASVPEGRLRLLLVSEGAP
ncbi:MAG: SAF domain-containing protein [Actinomycetota bacterium]